MTRAPKSEEAIRKKIESLVKQERTLYEKAGFDRRHIIVFPNGKVPLIGRIGVWLTRKARGTVQVEYIAVKPKK
jgi:uncharacterized Fe-S cluster-containing radical SAM superfamily enzyme